MNKKTYFKLYISFLIFAFLIFIIPSVFVNMIGYIFLDLARPAMFISKFIDLLIFVSAAMIIDLIVIFIIWLVCRTKVIEDKYVRPINGLEFDKSNIVSINKKKFGLMLLVTFELNNYKNIHYFFNNNEDLNKWLEDNNLLDLLSNKEFKRFDMRFWIKISIFVIALCFVFRDAHTSNKTFRKGWDVFSRANVFRPMNYNNDYIVTNKNIYNRNTNKRVAYQTTSTWPNDGEHLYNNYPIDINLYSDYFTVTFYSDLISSGKGAVKLIEEKIDYNGVNKGFIKDEEVSLEEFSELLSKKAEWFNGDSILLYILNRDMEISLGNKNDIFDYCYAKRGKHPTINLAGNTKTIGDYTYFSLHVYKKREDSRYIGLSGLYKYNNDTKDIEVIKEFKGKKIINFNENYVIYLDYKTIYKYDLKTDKKTKITNIANYKDVEIYYGEHGMEINCYSKNKLYFLDEEGNLIGKGRWR